MVLVDESDELSVRERESILVGSLNYLIGVSSRGSEGAVRHTEWLAMDRLPPAITGVWTRFDNAGPKAFAARLY